MCLKSLEIFQKLLYNQYMKNCFKISHNADKNIEPIFFHSHDFCEIYLFEDGNVTYYIEDESYNLKKGDVLVISPGKLHRPVIENGALYERYVLWLYEDYINSKKGLSALLSDIETLIAKKKTRLVSFEEDKYDYLFAIFNKLTNAYLNGDEHGFYLSESCIGLIVDELFNALSSALPMVHSDKLVAQVIAYINENVTNAPSLDELAKKFFVSKYYLSHKFKEYTKTSVHKYVLMKKSTLQNICLNRDIHPVSLACNVAFLRIQIFIRSLKIKQE